MKQVSHNIQGKYAFAKSAYHTFKAAQKMRDDQEKKQLGDRPPNETEEEKKQQMMKDLDQNDIKNMTENGIDVMWNITIFDVESTLRAAIDKILRDKAVDQECRLKRA